MNYASTKFKIKDGLPKFKDLPEGFGGSNVMLNEDTLEEVK